LVRLLSADFGPEEEVVLGEPIQQEYFDHANGHTDRNQRGIETAEQNAL
jgi:hypothetical protein